MLGAGLLAILLAYSCALVAPLPRYWPGGRIGRWLGYLAAPLAWLCLLVVPAEFVGARAACAFVIGDLAFRLVDFLRQWDAIDPRIRLREFHRFLIPFPVLGAVYPDHKRSRTRPESPWPWVFRVVAGSAGFTLAILATRALTRTALLGSSFALNHAALLPCFVIAVESISRALHGLERLLGFDTTPIIRDAYLARTPAEFWRRYNGRIHAWLYRNVFEPSGGRRAPARATALVFLASGLFHELAFSLATSRVTGYQLAFFLLQAPAVLASGRLERLDRRGGIAGKIVAHGVTIAFLGITSVLFFDGVARIFPFIHAKPR